MSILEWIPEMFGILITTLLANGGYSLLILEMTVLIIMTITLQSLLIRPMSPLLLSLPAVIISSGLLNPKSFIA